MIDLQSFWRRLTGRRRLGDDIDEELRFHLEMRARRNVERGMSEPEARREANLRFGSFWSIRALVREVRGVGRLDPLMQDLRYGLRLLRKSPGFAIVAILTLALGIGGNAAIFSIVNSVLLRPLSYHKPEQLYLIREIVPQLAKFYPSFPANVPDFRIWQKECRSFEAIAIIKPASMALTGRGPAEQIYGGVASANLFEVLGVSPAAGRSFMPEEDQPGRDHVVILTESFLRDRFQADRSLIGDKIMLDGVPHEVVGILPASFHFPVHIDPLVAFGPRVDFFKPLGINPGNNLIGEFDFAAIARLKAGVVPSQALRDLNIVQARIAQQAKEGMDLTANLLPLENEVVGPARGGLIMLLGAVGVVLLIVCVNLAGLLLARGPARMREAAIRAALGASRFGLVRTMLAESLLLALAGGLAGIVLAHAGLNWLVHSAPADLPRLEEVGIDGRVLWFTLILSIFTGILFGILPAWRATQAVSQQSLKTGNVRVTEGRRVRRLRGSLVGIEVCLSTLLLVLAGLLTMSLAHVLNVNKGFSVEHVLTADVQLPPQSYSDVATRKSFYDRAIGAIQALPGVLSVGWVNLLPLEGHGTVSLLYTSGEPAVRPEMTPLAMYRVANPGYFQAMGIPLLAGRTFTERDHGRNVVIVSQSVTERFWLGENPIGKICVINWGGDRREEVVGVVSDVRTVRLDDPPAMMVYLPDSHGQAKAGPPAEASIIVRTINPQATAAAVRRALQNIDPDVPVRALRPMEQVVSKSLGVRRFQMSLALLFAACALFLAALGIYGVLSYSVEQRRGELGIRMALGAQTGDLQRLVIRQGMTPVAVGLGCGLISALFLGRFVRSLLFGLSAQDPLTIVLVAFVVVAAAALACYIPAARMTRLDPLAALRCE